MLPGVGRGHVQGVERPYLDQGDGPVVLFVHGSNVDHRIWTDHGEILSRRYRVIAPTQRYFGASAWPDNGMKFSVKVHADDLAAFIGAMKLDPVSIVGWSYGAAVCIAMATLHPGLTKQLFLYEPTLATFVQNPVAAKRAMDDRAKMFSAAKAEASEGNNEIAVRLFMDGVNDRDGSFGNLPESVQRIMVENSRMLPLLFSAPPPPQVSCENLSRLDMPVTVALGDESRMFYKIASESAAQCIPGARFVNVPGARHLWPIENPTGFSQLVLDFLEGTA